MFGNKHYSYFSHDILESMREALVALDEPRRLNEVCEHIRDARDEWFVEPSPLSSSGIDKLGSIFMQQLLDTYGKIEVFGEEFWADELYEKIYGEDHIKEIVLAQFAEQELKLPNAESWETIMDAWGEIKAMANSILNNEGEYTYDDIQTGMDNLVDLFDAYYGWD